MERYMNLLLVNAVIVFGIFICINFNNIKEILGF